MARSRINRDDQWGDTSPVRFIAVLEGSKWAGAARATYALHVIQFNLSTTFAVSRVDTL